MKTGWNQISEIQDKFESLRLLSSLLNYNRHSGFSLICEIGECLTRTEGSYLFLGADVFDLNLIEKYANALGYELVLVEKAKDKELIIVDK